MVGTGWRWGDVPDEELQRIAGLSDDALEQELLVCAKQQMRLDAQRDELSVQSGVLNREFEMRVTGKDRRSPAILLPTVVHQA